MCGITGIAASHGAVDRAWLSSGTAALRHRGPDDAGEWWSADGRVGLGHRRLAIIDLSPGGRQPMVAPTRELVIVFNGEIYNYRELRAELAELGHAFKSASDTEVLLAAYREWGTACLDKLNGMFAFALFDARDRSVFLARDRAGEKPLFYAIVDGTLLFASELKSLLLEPRIARRVDPLALECYLAEGFVPGDRSILDGVVKLPPAHALRFELDGGGRRVWRYWHLPALRPRAVDERRVEELLEEVETLLESAVRRQLVADVPVGVLLSGGVDSSLVTALAVRAASRVKTFTVSFPGHGRYDEAAHARLIARHFGTDHVELEADSIMPDLLPALARQFDEPLIDSSMIPSALVTRLVRNHCTVALGGDGGDELFGGYSHYDRLLALERWARPVPAPVRVAGARLATAVLPIGFKGRNWLQALEIDLNNNVPMIASYFDRAARRALLPQRPSAEIDAERFRDERARSAMGEGDLLQRATRLDFATYLPEDILVKVDRASMLSSLEMRAPMLDVHVVEFAFREVSSELKTTAASRKVLLKKLAAKLLPPTFDRERKQGFSVPLSAWLQSGPWLAFFKDILLAREQNVFDHGFIARLIAGVQAGRANSERLFGLLMFELWRREYRISLG
jgi:asparagine synthase (glutamine-hydrolysing)